MPTLAEVLAILEKESKIPDFINNVLSPRQRAVVKNKEELVFIAKLERIMQEYIGAAIQIEMRFTPKDILHYMGVQQGWIADEMHYAKQDLGHEPSASELRKHFELTGNGARFKIFYFLKYGDKMTDLSDSGSNSPRPFGTAA